MGTCSGIIGQQIQDIKKMAKYREIWPDPLTVQIIGYVDTETSRNIPLNDSNPFYQDFLQWQSEGGIPDPAYTQQEIDEYQAAFDRQIDIETEKENAGVRDLTVDEAKQIVTDRLDIVRALPESNLAEIQAKILELCDQTEWLIKKLVVFVLR